MKCYVFLSAIAGLYLAMLFITTNSLKARRHSKFKMRKDNYKTTSKFKGKKEKENNKQIGFFKFLLFFEHTKLDYNAI